MENTFKKDRIRKQNFTALAIIIVGTILSLIFFLPKDKNNQEVLIKEETASKKVQSIVLGNENQNKIILEKKVKFSSSRSADLVAEYSGRIEKVSFEVGDFVTEGQVLAYFEQAENSNLAKNAFVSAEKSYELANKNLAETEKISQKTIDLAKNGENIAEIQLDQAKESEDESAIDLAKESLEIAQNQRKQAENSAKAQTNGAKLQLEQANLGLKQARLGYEKTFIKAPISGKIVSKNINQNDFIGQGFSIGQIVGEGRLETTVYLDQDEARGLSAGDVFDIEFENEKYSGKVKAISKIANQSNERFEVLLETNENFSQFVNQFVSIKLFLSVENGGNFFLPIEAVNIGQTKKDVFVIENGLAKMTSVETGKIIGKQIEIVSGLEKGDKVIIAGGKSLEQGQRVVSE